MIMMIMMMIHEWQNDDDEYTENQQQRIADAVNLLPRLADGINVNIRFRRLNLILCLVI